MITFLKGDVMNTRLPAKIAITIIILLACMQIIGLCFAWVNCKTAEENVLELWGFIGDNNSDIMEQSIRGDCPLDLFFKNTAICLLNCRILILLVLLLTLIMDVFLFLYFFKNRTKAINRTVRKEK